MYKICSQKLLGVDFKSAQDHDDWFKVYSKLSNSNKAAILSWKKSKQTLIMEDEDVKEQPLTIVKDNASLNLADNRKQRELKKYEIQLWKVINNAHLLEFTKRKEKE